MSAYYHDQDRASDTKPLVVMPNNQVIFWLGPDLPKYPRPEPAAEEARLSRWKVAALAVLGLGVVMPIVILAVHMLAS